MRYQEPQFMRELHRQRERESRILYTRFKGDWRAYGAWRDKRLENTLATAGYVLKSAGRGTMKLVRATDARK